MSCNAAVSLFVVDPESVDFNECIVHDLSSVFKQYLRELPIPVMTFDLYDEFMRAAGQNCCDTPSIQHAVLNF